MSKVTRIEKLEDLIKDSIGGEVVEQTVAILLPPGENAGSVVYKVDFKVKKGDKEEEYHAIAKCPPLNAVSQDIFNVQDTFKAEISWYTTVIPALKQFYKDQGVGKEIDFFVPFYGARINLDPTSDKVDKDGVILFQNITDLGYYTIDKNQGFDLPTTYTLLRDLATFHAVPLAIKIKNPELFKTKITPFLPRFGDSDGALQRGYRKQIYTVFEHIPECQPDIERIKKNIKQAIVFGERPVRQPWATVIHMDYWTNNVMVTGGEDSKNMILDLQFPYLGSPGADIAFLLFTSVNFDVIKDKFDDFIEFYYEQFTKNLRELNVPTENYTFEGLLEELKTEVSTGEFSHSLSHTLHIMEDKGKTYMNPASETFEKGNLDVVIVPNEKQKRKFRWIASEAIKRNWI